jgi:transketolase
MSNMHLHPISSDMLLEPTRKGFGIGLVEAGRRDSNVVALCADLTGSTQIDKFAKEFPARFIQVGIAEQNLVTVGSGGTRKNTICFIVCCI